MDFIIAICFGVLSAVLGMVALTRQFQMLQQNSYFAVRYWRWYKGSFKLGRLLYIVISLLGSMGAFFALSLNTVWCIVLLAGLFLFLSIVARRSVALNKNPLKNWS